MNLPEAHAIFDIAYFRQDPKPFYALARELYPGKYRPTLAHVFIKLLHDKGRLLKHFSQNIDCLEREAGLPAESIIEAHGSFASQHCIDCGAPYPSDLMKAAIDAADVPLCLECGGFVKPDIVFFGEALPEEFFLHRLLPAAADLCIVMGTSLSVFPFAGLPARCREDVPRVLINSERVGELGSRPNDVLLLGDCDAGVRKFAQALGWLEELEALWEHTKPATIKSQEAEDELLRNRKDEVEIISSKVERLRLHIDQHLNLTDLYQKKVREHLAKEQANAGDGESALADRPSETPSSLTPLPALISKELPATAVDLVYGNLDHVFPHLAKKPSPSL